MPRFRRFKTRNRQGSHWLNLQLEENRDMFFECFRMTHSSFNLLCDKLRPHLKESQDSLTPPVPVEKQIAICTSKLATCAEYRVVANVFGVSKCTVWKYFHCVVDALMKIRSQYICFPESNEALEIAEEFERIAHISNIFGCIDGTHIAILPPKNGYRDYINRKGWASMVLQAVVDNKYMFRDINIQFPGSAHDATVFKESGLYKNASTMIPHLSIDFNGTSLPLMLAGDPAYPLMQWLLKPFTGNLSAEEESFNCHLSSARIRVENAFGRLKGRWRCIGKRIDVNPKFVSKVAMACAILHNFVEQQKKTFREHWLEMGNELLQPNSDRSHEVISGTDLDPKCIRIYIKDYLAANFLLRTSSN